MIEKDINTDPQYLALKFTATIINYVFVPLDDQNLSPMFESTRMKNREESPLKYEFSQDMNSILAIANISPYYRRYIASELEQLFIVGAFDYKIILGFNRRILGIDFLKRIYGIFDPLKSASIEEEMFEYKLKRNVQERVWAGLPEIVSWREWKDWLIKSKQSNE